MQAKYVLRFGSTGDLVYILQDLLGAKRDGQFGRKTKGAVENFQTVNGLKADGIVGPMTWKKLGYNPLELDADTDVTTSATWIEQYNLPEGEYVRQETPKSWIFLHHTAGRSNPYKVIDHWAKDQRGRVGTHYVIGGLPTGADVNNLTKKDTEYDGKVLQAIKDEFWGYHLGRVKSSQMHKNSISIEICSPGYLTEKNGKYYTWYNAEVHPSQVERLEVPFKGKRYYHRYSQAQLDSLKGLIYALEEKHGIDIKSGLPQMLQSKDASIAFDYSEDANYGRIKGILSHGQVRTGKTDLFPQPELVEMLKQFR